MLFREFLKLDVSIEISDNLNCYLLSFDDRKTIKIADVLLSDSGKDYMSNEFIPEKVKLSQFVFADEEFLLAIIFGEDSIKIENEEIEIGFDLIGSAFFMLTRMEEIITSDRDEHGRFSTESALSVKQNFYRYPVVDIYIRLLQRLIEYLFKGLEKKSFESIILPSHDLDHLNKLQNLRSLGGAVKRALGGKKALSHSSSYFLQYINRRNPFDQINRFLKLADSANTSATFYFLVGGDSKYDPGHFDHFRKSANNFKKEIQSSNHKIGLHPSYETISNQKLLEVEKEKIEKWLGYSVEFSRQHYLRVDISKTWSSLENCGLKYDTSLGFPQFPGFRCGTSREFPVFDLIKKEELNLREIPLIAMDTSLLKDERYSLEDKYSIISGIKGQIRENGGNWHFLIHNSNFFWLDEEDYFELWHSFYEF